MRGHWEVTLSIIALFFSVVEGLQKAMPCRKIRPFDKKWKFSIIPNVRPLVSWLGLVDGVVCHNFVKGRKEVRLPCTCRQENTCLNQNYNKALLSL